MPIINCDTHRTNCETLVGDFRKLDAAPQAAESPDIAQVRLLLVIRAHKVLQEFEEVWHREGITRREPSLNPHPRNLEGDPKAMWQAHLLVCKMCDDIVGQTTKRLGTVIGEVFGK